MTNRRTTRRFVTLAATSTMLAWLAGGCGDSTEEKLRAAKLAQGCSINSDCEGDLVCVFERCHIACNEDEDCTDPLRCVRGADGQANVCQLEDEVGCDRDRDCPGEQVCGVDEECRDSCREDDECIAGQVCAVSAECASTDPGKDELDELGNIVLEGAENGGSAGAPAAGGASSGGSSTGGEESGSGGSGGTLSAAGQSASAGDSNGSAGEAAGGVDSGPTGDYVETSDGVEPVANGDRDHALAASARSSLYFTVGDEDWLKVSAPSDARAHVIELELQQQAGLRTGVQALAGSDFAVLGQTLVATGVTTRVYVSVGPGTTTLLRFWPYVGASAAAGKRLELAIHLSAEEDENEPNDTPDTATPIELNTPVSAQFINPFASATSQAIEDWYEVQLEEGTATLNLLQAPEGGRFVISRETTQGASLHIQTPLSGVTGAWSFAVPTSGTYRVGFGAYTGFSPFVEGTKPEYLSEPYVFEVQQ
ncbi:MAG: hypothetical protein EOO73_12130 [Myxococcales bacterium]|nr:MAG: hypothetical protein EOO73_12130 [Myxococcales bacterium]